MLPHNLTDFAVSVALEAGQVALEYFHRAELETGLKADRSLLSEADAATEELIARRVKESYPDHPLIGEETVEEQSAESYPQALAAECAWVVDPIDGTNNFVAGNPLWCVSIGLLGRGMPEVGVIYFPAMNDELYYNEGEALLVRSNASSQDPRNESVPVRDAAAAAPLFMVHDTFFRRYDVGFRHFPRISGCTVMNILHVVTGRALAATHSAHLWDFAAPMAFARSRAVEMSEAFSGRRLRAFTPDDFFLDPEDPTQLWKVREQCLVAGRERIEELRKTFVRRKT